MVMPRKLEHLASINISNSRLNVRYWHKADIATVLNDVRFWG